MEAGDREDLNRDAAKKRKREFTKTRSCGGTIVLRRNDAEIKKQLRVEACDDESSEAQTVNCCSLRKVGGTAVRSCEREEAQRR